MHGFKSFAKRVELDFDGNFNVVLGPNGSGKSNVIDALCFVLGKRSSKAMRAKKAANLIFNGGKHGTPSKQAEVSIVFDNSDKVFPIKSNEVKISRFVKPKGHSIYKINEKTRTRQQIIDLLNLADINAEGYNIILQGDITHFVEMPPSERREIIAEISGIAVYEEKKHKAMNELDKVDEKMEEARVILRERGTYLKELKRDRDQAVKFKKLNDKIDQNNASYLKLQMDAKQKKILGLEKRKNGFKKDFDKVDKKILDFKTNIQNKRKEISEITSKVEKEGDEDVSKLNKEIENLRVEIASNKTKISSNKDELAKIKNRKVQLDKNLEEIEQKEDDYTKDYQDLKGEKVRLEKDHQNILEKISTFKKKHKLGEKSEKIEKDIEEIDKENEGVQEKVQKLRTKQHDLFRQKDTIEFNLSNIDEKLEKISKIKKEHKEKLGELEGKRSNFKRITLDLNNSLDNNSAISAQLSNAREKSLKISEEISKISIRHSSVMEKSLGNVAINSIIKNKKQFNGVYGLVSDLGEVNSKYSLALEVAAGARLKSIVVENDAVASKCINYLKQNRLGVATFLPLNKLNQGAVRNFGKVNGSHGSALDLVSFDPKFKKAFAYVFGNTLVVEDISAARSIGIGKVRMVTLEGDLIETSGAMRGGFRKRKSGLGFKEKELTSDLNKLKKRKEDLVGIISTLENQKIESDDKIQKLRGDKATLSGEIVVLEKSLHLQDSDLDVSADSKDEMVKSLKDVEKNLTDVAGEISACNKLIVELNNKKIQFRGEIVKIKNPTLLAELNSFEQKETDIREELIKVNAKISTSKKQYSEFSSREKERIEKIIKDGEKESSEFKKQIEELNGKVARDSKILKARDENVKKLYSKFKVLFDKRSKLQENITEIEKDIYKLDEKSRGIETQMNMISLDVAKYKAEFAGLEEEFVQYKDVKIIKKPLDELKKEIRAFERMRQNIGSVNMKALEIYESVEEKYNSLLDKKKKLEGEKEEILKMMKEIEEKKIELFMNTFREINEKFEELFAQIYTKDEKVYLEIENKDNPFEGGVNIKARITGRKYLDIISLSGGEQTLTALAFIFAIQEYAPASFYILDEVDAALDKHNSEKVARLVRKYSGNAQYIVISHNDGIISEADNLYGVTMNEKKISKIVSLKI